MRDPRHLEKPIKVQRLDTGTGVLVPLVDNERKIVYLAGKVRISPILRSELTFA